ncbi:hypothetical protein A6X21_03335 [Planctopirus hydrillae]|uniref:Uncharacterized protein n=1 Tax=Planctopirus hydrillae TaxID=1841610 RepID=A0A1C3EN94_9PLAN|nr:hypothetical protein A6X21_03335 [Planctopirus hydrillae]
MSKTLGLERGFQSSGGRRTVTTRSVFSSRILAGLLTHFRDCSESKQNPAMPMRGTFSLLRRGVSEDSAAAKSSFLFFLKFFRATKNLTQVPRIPKREFIE